MKVGLLRVLAVFESTCSIGVPCGPQDPHGFISDPVRVRTEARILVHGAVGLLTVLHGLMQSNGSFLNKRSHLETEPSPLLDLVVCSGRMRKHVISACKCLTPDRTISPKLLRAVQHTGNGAQSSGQPYWKLEALLLLL